MPGKMGQTGWGSPKLKYRSDTQIMFGRYAAKIDEYIFPLDVLHSLSTVIVVVTTVWSLSCHILVVRGIMSYNPTVVYRPTQNTLCNLRVSMFTTSRMHWNSHQRSPVKRNTNTGVGSKQQFTDSLPSDPIKRCFFSKDGHQWNYSETSTPKIMNMQHNGHIHNRTANKQNKKIATMQIYPITRRGNGHVLLGSWIAFRPDSKYRKLIIDAKHHGIEIYADKNSRTMTKKCEEIGATIHDILINYRQQPSL